MTPQGGSEAKGRKGILEVIDRPLGFYVLALLIVETFLGVTVNVGSPGDSRALGIYCGVGMFVYITLTVTVIVWNRPHVLMFGQEAHLRERRRHGPFGTEARPVKGPDKLPPPEARPGEP